MKTNYPYLKMFSSNENSPETKIHGSSPEERMMTFKSGSLLEKRKKEKVLNNVSFYYFVFKVLL